jgi:hypothetical protein
MGDRISFSQQFCYRSELVQQRLMGRPNQSQPGVSGRWLPLALDPGRGRQLDGQRAHPCRQPRDCSPPGFRRGFQPEGVCRKRWRHLLDKRRWGTDPIVWTSLNHHLGITQFYGAAGHVATGKIIGGAQDNGTIQFNGDPENWSTAWGGDGGYCAVDQTNDPYFYGEYIRLQIFRVVNGVAQCIDAGIGDAPATHDCNQLTGGNADFIAPFVLDPNNANRILAGGRRLWRSNNVRATNPSDVSWAAIREPSPPNCTSNCQNITAIAVAPGNSDIVWVGYNDGSVYFTTNGTVATPTWTQRSNGLLSPRRCTRIMIGNASQIVVPNEPQGGTPFTLPSGVTKRTTSGKH